MISRDVIDQIKLVAKIEDVIGEYIELKPRGKNLFGKCPFHKEVSPSFSVSPQKGIYKCFGCGKAGKIIEFVMTYKNINYYEALKLLADKYNIPI